MILIVVKVWVIAMKYIKVIVICFFSLFIFHLNPYAEVCDENEIAMAKALANNVTVDYHYIGNIEDKSFLQYYSITLHTNDLGDNVYASHLSYSNFNLYNNHTTDIVSGKHTFYLYYSKCSDTKIGKITVDLKRFNEYSLKEECKGLENTLDVCDSWNQSQFTDDYFEKVMNEYHKKDVNVFVEFLQKYYLYIGIVSVIVIIFIIVLAIRHHIKTSRLD